MLSGFRGSNSSKNSGHTRNQSSMNVQPPGKSLVDGYSKTNGGLFQGLPRINANYDAQDPISMHLLMENALGKSKTYEVLSPEDVDGLEKELSVLAGRIEVTQRKLALETKVRDGMNSVARLQKPGAANGVKRGSQESEETSRKCEQIAEELWRMEKQEHQLSTALFQHELAVLQMTHKGYLKDKADADRSRNNDDIISDYDASEFGDLSHYRPSSLTLDEMAFGPSVPDTRKEVEAVFEIDQSIDKLIPIASQMMQKAQISPNDLPSIESYVQSGLDVPRETPHVLAKLGFLEACMTMQIMSGEESKESNERVQKLEQALHNIAVQIFDKIIRRDPETSLSEPPRVYGDMNSVTLQSEYVTEATNLLQAQLDEVEKNLQELWNSLVSPEEAKEFSPERLFAKVREIHDRSLGLQEAKNILTRQIQQQRELNDTADHAKDAKIDDLMHQLDAVTEELAKSQQETNFLLEKLASVTEELELAKSRVAQSEQQRGFAESQVLDAERQARQDLEQQLQRTKAELEQQLEQARANFEAKAAEAQKADEAFKELEGHFVRTQTELTIAKAELDSAYGSRAERAAEKAADPVLQARIQKLESELGETISDYETMTKATIEHEKERETMESTIDGLRDKVESLESELNDEKINTLGVKSPGNSSDRGGVGTSASVLRSEFRKMMRDMRSENSKALKVERDERQKLETALRALKKDQLQTRPFTK